MKTLKEIRARLLEIDERLREIADVEEPDDEAREEFDTLTAEFDELDEQRVTMEEESRKEEERAAKVAKIRESVQRGDTVPGEDRGANPPNVNVRTDDPFDLSTVASYGAARQNEVTARTLTAIEESTRFTSDRHRERATEIVERYGRDTRNRWMSELILLRTDERYCDAFLRAAFDKFGPSDEDRRYLAQVDELRALALSDVTGVMVPAHLDATVILSNDGTANPFRRVARVESGTTNVYTSLTTAGITASWDAEAAEVSDDAPSFSNPTVTAYKGAAFVPISIEAFEDARGREGEIVTAIVDAKDRLESTAFATGNGSSQPRGLVTALDANTNVEVQTATINVFAIADVYTLYEAVPARFRNDRTAWFSNVAIINDIRQFGTEDYHTQTVQLGERLVPGVLGHPILESSAMDSEVTVDATNNLLVVGDPSQYLIYDRIGLSVELVPHLFHTDNNLPSGQRGWYAHWRTGANTVVDTAFRLLHTGS